MVTFSKVVASRRSELGTTACRRLRQKGLVPANVYGHGQPPLSVSIDGETLRPIIAAGAKVVDLDIDGQTEKALVREVQWDTYSTEVRHVDFVRVDANERVHVDVPVVLRGTAPGVLAGGILEQPLHALHIECLAVQIPDNIVVRIHMLEIGETIHVSDLVEIPEGVQIMNPPEAVVIHIVQAGPEPEVATAPGETGTQPELIRKKKEDEGESA